MNLNLNQYFNVISINPFILNAFFKNYQTPPVGPYIFIIDLKQLGLLFFIYSPNLISKKYFYLVKYFSFYWRYSIVLF